MFFGYMVMRTCSSDDHEDADHQNPPLPPTCVILGCQKRCLTLITLRKILRKNTTVLQGHRWQILSLSEALKFMLQKDISVLIHINLQDMPELPLMICHCYLSKLGLQAVYVISLLHHLQTVSFSSSKLFSFKLKGVTQVDLGLRGNKKG